MGLCLCEDGVDKNGYDKGDRDHAVHGDEIFDSP